MSDFRGPVALGMQYCGMRTNIAVAALLLFVLPLPAQETKTNASSQVTIPLETYDTMRRNSDVPSRTVIDTILLSGGFRERNLSITFTGRTLGTRPLAPALQQANDVTISGCSGNAIVARTGKGAFDLIPLAESFEVECDLRISGSDRLRMHVTPSVLAVRSNVADAELVAGDEDDTGARDYTLVRHVAGPGETLAATATGRYLITLLPDATRFRYAIDVHNPNRTTASLELVLQSNEHLQQIDSVAPYEVNAGRYVFATPPGDTTITLTGELRGTSFIAPVRASLQYLVIESHPLLRPSVQTPAKRISLGETGVTVQYRGALAFETGTERITWQVTRLQALHAISYAVNNASHRVFVPVDGPVLGESIFALRNEGAPELVLPPKPEPTYVSLGGEPVLMTKNATGQLTVPLSQGEQSVLVQHRQALPRAFGFAAGRIAVPQLAVAATDTHLHLTYPARWIPLYETFASRARVWTPDAGQILLFVLLALWIERLLGWLGFDLNRRLLIAILTAFAAMLVTLFLSLVLVVFGALTVAWIVSQPMRSRVALGAVFGVAILILLLYFGSRGLSSKYEVSSSREEAMTDTVATDTSMTAGDVAQAPTRDPAAPATGGMASVSYQGLPAKFLLPGGQRQSSFSQELLRTDRPQTAFVLAISSALVNWLGVLLALIPIVLLWRDRHRIAEAVRTRLAQAAPAD
ncbi:MAG TPA: hypothetical protein VFV49_15410 [Thermoanaerobaculia bacterium]|nr:hypothetical protein [Thermoanaerobaculia bacterium]